MSILLKLNTISNSKDIKKTWSLLNSIISSKKKSHSVPEIFTDDEKSVFKTAAGHTLKEISFKLVVNFLS